MDDEEYPYYKYCEEEWDLYEDIKEISGVLQAEYSEMEEQYDDNMKNLHCGMGKRMMKIIFNGSTRKRTLKQTSRS